MTNKHTRPIQATMFINKLQELLAELHRRWQIGELSTQEEVIAEFNSQLNTFFLNLRDPNFTPIRAITGLRPREEDYNEMFDFIGKDLNIIFKELKTAEDVILGNFNHIITERDRLNKEIKSIGSKLGDYILFTDDPLGLALYFKDSFNDVSKIDVGSNRLNATQAEINQAEGIITLAIDRDAGPTEKTVREAIINTNSNGQEGNNFQVGANIQNDITKILDGNPDSWFEYERVQRTLAENTDPLKLDLTLSLEDEQVINFIRVNPNNFGTQNWLTIQEIETSVDGNVFVSVKDDIPISGFLAEDEENIFQLAPSVSKFAGQGLYTFTPRKAKYIHIVLLQNTSYPIETSSGIQQRFAIGIRDIEIQALPYLAESELVSVPFVAPEEIKKISIIGSENPTEASELADIKHQISPDDGNTWFDIQPEGRTGITIPEILSLNTADDDSVVTPTPVTQIRHKLILSRNSTAFTEGASTLRQTVQDTVELVNLPTTSPFKVSIEKAPVDGSVALLNPLFGSRGKETPKLLLGVSNGDEVQFDIPLEPRGDIEDFNNFKNEIRLFVDNIEWFRVGSFDDNDPQTGNPVDADSRVFRVNNQNQVIFGDGVKGKIPVAGSIIGLTINSEQIFPTSDSPHKADLQFDSDGDKRNTIIRRVDPQKRITNELLTKNAQVFQAKNKNLILTSIRILEKDSNGIVIADTSDPTSIGAGTFRYEGTFRKAFIDGASELTGAGQWSVDVDNGRLYSFSPSSSVNNTSITYQYTPKKQLDNGEWDFVLAADNVRRGVEIKPAAYTTNAAEDIVTGGVKVLALSNTGIVPKTLSVPEDIFVGAGVTPVEVPFVNGIIELSNIVQVVDEEIGFDTSVVPGLSTFTLSRGDNLDPSFSPVFSNEVLFATEVVGVPSSDGEYKIDINTGDVTVYSTVQNEIDNPGNVNYNFIDETLNNSLPGKFSVDYKRGRLYSFSLTQIPPSGDKIKYQFTNYEIDYNIAKPIDSDSFLVDAEAQEISINDTEIIKAYNSIDVVSRTRQIIKIMYQFVERTRDSIEELEPFFSPIVKDYVLKILTKSRI